MIYEKSCGAVVFTDRRGERLYLVEQMKKGHFSMCKGHVEEGESEYETAAREIFEETGLSVEFIDGFRESIEYSPYKDCMKTVVYYLARSSKMDVTVQEEEVREIQWLPINKAVKTLTYASDRETIQKAEEFLRKEKQ